MIYLHPHLVAGPGGSSEWSSSTKRFLKVLLQIEVEIFGEKNFFYFPKEKSVF